MAPNRVVPIPETAQLLGEVVTWDIAQPEVPVDTIIAAAEKFGLRELMPPDISYGSAFKRACRRVFKREMVVDKLPARTAGTSRFYISTRKEEDDAVHYTPESAVTVNETTGDINGTSVAITLRAEVEHSKNHRLPADITRMIQNMFRRKAELFPVNPHKGVAYFVPIAYQPFIEAVQGFMEAIGGWLWRFPVPKGTPAGNCAVRESINAGLQMLIDELNEAATQWTDKTRKSTIDKSLERWEEVKLKVELYADYLDVRRENLLKELDRTRELIASTLSKLTEEEAQAEAQDTTGEQDGQETPPEQDEPIPQGAHAALWDEEQLETDTTYYPDDGHPLDDDHEDEDDDEFSLLDNVERETDA